MMWTIVIVDPPPCAPPSQRPWSGPHPHATRAWPRESHALLEPTRLDSSPRTSACSATDRRPGDAAPADQRPPQP